MKKLFNLSLIITTATLLTFCGGRSDSGNAAEAPSNELDSFVRAEFEYPIPNSYVVTNMLQAARAGYVLDITNPTDNIDKYVTTWQKALNLGVYGADLSYASTYNNREETNKYLDVSKQLIQDLNISTAFNKEMVSRIEKNLDNQDSLILIVTESFYETYNYLNQNGEEKTSLLVVGGSVIEGLYITSQLVISSNFEANLLTVFASQKDQVGKLVELMDAHSADENVNRVLPTFRYINLFYEQLGDDGSISEGQFNDVYNSIEEMRNSIIS